MATRAASNGRPALTMRGGKQVVAVVAITMDSERARARIAKNAEAELTSVMKKAAVYARNLALRELSTESRQLGAGPDGKATGKSRRQLSGRINAPRFADSFEVEVEVSRQRIRVTLVNRHRAAWILEKGSAPHTMPKKGSDPHRIYAFPPSSGSGRFFVNGPPFSAAQGPFEHPGTRPYRFLARTADAIRRNTFGRTPKVAEARTRAFRNAERRRTRFAASRSRARG